MMQQPPLPPHNIQAEQALLGAVLLNNSNYGAIANLIDPADFFEPLHKQILFQMGELIVAGKSATPVTLQDAFPDVEMPGGMTVRRYLASLMAEGINTAADLNTFTTRVRDLAEMRAILLAADAMGRAPFDGVAPEGALAEVWERLDSIRSAHGDDTTQRGPISKHAAQLLEDDTSPVVSTGLVDLDRAIAGGWRAGRLYVLAGRPGMGKTVFGLSTARRVARKGEGVSAFLLEIDAREGTARIVADELARSSFPIPYRDIVANTLDTSQRERVGQAVERISQLPIYLDATGGLSMTEIEARAKVDKERFAKSGRRLGAVVIDYLGLLKASERYRGQKVHELGEMALAGKTMAKRLDTAVILLSQLNRSVENRDDKRPTMSDLRDSGNIEEHADFVGLLYRPFYYIEKSPQWRNQDPETVDRGERDRLKLELIIGKNRLGPTTMIDLWCDPSLAAVDNRARY
jgi:replicative DNA helicase